MLAKHVLKNKSACTGCEACTQICPFNAIKMERDDEGFYYPVINETTCKECGLCRKVCPSINKVKFNEISNYVFGGQITDNNVLAESTSGGAFTAICKAYVKNVPFVIYGAESKGLNVFHSRIEKIEELYKFRQSKYSQSRIGDCYKLAKNDLKQGKTVIFSGTPCQISGLYSYLGSLNCDKLLTIEVVCEGVPSPLYIEKMNNHFLNKKNSEIEKIQYRYKDLKKKDTKTTGKWDFEVMNISLQNTENFKADRWFNPFWSVWLQHLITRPSCYECKYAKKQRVADITLGDLWGVHIYCPELYANNTGASLVFANNAKGKAAVIEAEKLMDGHCLCFEDAIKFQGPMRRTLPLNKNREKCLSDLKNTSMTYSEFNKKWAKRPTLKLLTSKYIWGNRQKVRFYNLVHKEGDRL